MIDRTVPDYLPKACVFDAYGTLFDYASAAAEQSEIPGGKRDLLTRLWREKQLQYTWLRSLQNKHADFWQVTADALDFALDTLEIQDSALRGKLLNSYLVLKPFPEVRAVLERLREQGIKTAILSNGTPEMLRAAIANAKLDGLLDAVLSVEEVSVYKPHPKVYQLAVDRLQARREEICFHSSNAWDAWAASAFGMRVVWCNRYGQRAEYLPGRPDYVVASLAELPYLPAAAN